MCRCLADCQRPRQGQVLKYRERGVRQLAARPVSAMESQVHGAEELSELPGLVCIVAHQPRFAARLSIVNPDGLPRGDRAGCEQKNWGRPVRSPNPCAQPLLGLGWAGSTEQLVQCHSPSAAPLRAWAASCCPASPALVCRLAAEHAAAPSPKSRIRDGCAGPVTGPATSVVSVTGQGTALLWLGFPGPARGGTCWAKSGGRPAGWLCCCDGTRARTNTWPGGRRITNGPVRPVGVAACKEALGT